MTDKRKHPILHNFQTGLIAGILVVGPLGITYLMLKIIFQFLDGFFAPLVYQLR